jgi:hypothetical protein
MTQKLLSDESIHSTEKPMKSKTLISQDVELKTALHQRGENISAIGLRDLRRYYALLNYHLLELSLTASEANLICEALKYYLFEDDPEQTRTIWRQVDTAIRQDQLDQKWSVNREALMRKFQSLTDLQVVALVDAVERYWVRDQSNSHEPLETRLSRVGLVKCCDSAL